MSRFLAGLLITAAVLAGVYAFVAALASRIAPAAAPTVDPSLSSRDSARQSRFFTFASAVKQATSEHRAAREKCELLTGEEQITCNAAAKADQKRAKADARAKYKASTKSNADIKAPENAPVIAPRTAGGLDVVLYRAHRQWPD